MHFATDTQCDNLEPQCVARHDGAPKFCICYTTKERYLVVAILKFAEGEDGSDLSERFDLQHTRHYGRFGKMSGKKRLIDRHLLDADDTNARLKLDDLVHQQERKPVRQDLLNLL